MGPLDLLVEQKRVLHTIQANRRTVVLKSRQQAISTTCCLYDLLHAIFHPGQRVAIAADTWPKAEGLLAKCSAWAKSLELSLDVDNTTSLTISGGGTIDAVSTSARAGKGNPDSPAGRSFSYGHIHASELALWPTDAATMAALTSTMLPTAKVVVESTASAADNLFRHLWFGVDTAGQPIPDTWARVFLSVEEHEVYRTDPAGISDKRWAEMQVMGFTRRDSAAWWDDKLRQDFRGDVHRTLREYPPRADQAFSYAEGRWIHTFERILPIRETSMWREYVDVGAEPVTFGVDTGEGVGGDFSAIYIIGLWTGRTVATWSCNTLDVAAFAAVILAAHAKWKPRAIVIEKNGIGAGVLSLVRAGCSVAVAHKSTDAEKPVRFAAFRQALAEGWLKAGPCLETEIKSSVVDRDGKYTGRDDLINAGSFAVMYREKNGEKPPIPKPDLTRVYVPRSRRERGKHGLV